MTLVIGGEDSYLITISATWPDTLYYLSGQYYLIQKVKPCWHPEAMPPGFCKKAVFYNSLPS